MNFLEILHRVLLFVAFTCLHTFASGMLLEGVEVRVSVLINVSGAQVCASQTINIHNCFQVHTAPFLLLRAVQDGLDDGCGELGTWKVSDFVLISLIA